MQEGARARMLPRRTHARARHDGSGRATPCGAWRKPSRSKARQRTDNSSAQAREAAAAAGQRDSGARTRGNGRRGSHRRVSASANCKPRRGAARKGFGFARAAAEAARQLPHRVRRIPWRCAPRREGACGDFAVHRSPVTTRRTPAAASTRNRESKTDMIPGRKVSGVAVSLIAPTCATHESTTNASCAPKRLGSSAALYICACIMRHAAATRQEFLPWLGDQGDTIFHNIHNRNIVVK
jgi:hypothetical protein